MKALDASDLETWLAQSIPAQIWLAKELEIDTGGVETLDSFWDRRSGASSPRLTPEVFRPSLVAYRKKGSSLPGADLGGLHADSNGDCLAYGEVKTSSVAEYPPGVMYGCMGLQRQLEDIRDNDSTWDGLFRYLGHRALGSAWSERFRRATKRYLIDDFDVHLFGFRVRDIPPHEDDRRARVYLLGRGCPDQMKIELYALNLPANRIKGLGEAVLAARKGDRP